MDANEFIEVSQATRGYNKEVINVLFKYKETRELDPLLNTNTGYNIFIFAYVDENKKLVDIFDAANYTDNDLKSLWIDVYHTNYRKNDIINIRNQIVWHYFIKRKNNVIISLFKLLNGDNNDTIVVRSKNNNYTLADISGYLPFERSIYYYVECDENNALENQWVADCIARARYNSAVSYVFDQLALEIIYSLGDNKYYYGSIRKIVKRYIIGLTCWNDSKDADIYLNRKVFKETSKRFSKIIELSVDNPYNMNNYTLKDCISLDSKLQEMLVFSYSMALSFFTRVQKEYNNDTSKVESAIARLYNNYFSRHNCKDWKKRSAMKNIKFILDEKNIVGDTFLSELNDDLRSSYLEVSLNY